MNKEKLIKEWHKLGYGIATMDDHLISLFIEDREKDFTRNLLIFNKKINVKCFVNGKEIVSSLGIKELKLITKTMEFLKGSGE